MKLLDNIKNKKIRIIMAQVAVDKNGTECILCCNCIKGCPKNALDLK